jgi:choline transport protein
MIPNWQISLTLWAVIWSLLSFVVISITLLATSKKTDAAFVFAGFENVTGWGSGMAGILGIMQSALSLIGSDAATHMSEEMPDPARDTPRAMVYSVVMGGAT